MQSLNSVYFDGSFLPEDEARIPFTDRGFLFGDGVYATIQVREGVPLFLARHLERLRVQCLSFHLQMPYLDPSLIDKLINLNEATEGIWRLKIVISGGDLPDYRLPHREGRVLAFLNPFPAPSTHPLKMGIFSSPFSVCHASFKSLSHLNRFYVMEEALRQGLDDCITLTEREIVLEASFGNLFWVVGRRLFTPSPELPLYFGVTIENILEIGRSFGFSIEQIKIPLSDLPKEGLYFRTNSMGGIRPIEQIGRMSCHLDEEVARKFADAYFQSLPSPSPSAVCT